MQQSSLSLLSEAGYVLADVGGLALAIFAIEYTRKPPTLERTNGFFRTDTGLTYKQCGAYTTFYIHSI